MESRSITKSMTVTAVAFIVALSAAGCMHQLVPTPTACVQADPTIGYAPLTVSFDAACSHIPEGAEGVYHFQWEFDDGAEGTGRSAVHTYEEPGTYTVAVLMLRYDDGIPELVDIGSRVITVLPSEE